MIAKTYDAAYMNSDHRSNRRINSHPVCRYQYGRVAFINNPFYRAAILLRRVILRAFEARARARSDQKSAPRVSAQISGMVYTSRGRSVGAQ